MCSKCVRDKIEFNLRYNIIVYIDNINIMSKYQVGDQVLVKSGFDKIVSKYRITNKRYLNKNDMIDMIEFKYEYNKYEQNMNDPYVYYVSYDEDNICMELDDIPIFENMNLINSQIIGIYN